ncbi:MAG TPA: DUF167 domain-containing protein [Candidatus Saccharibacteria bacterium]|nr:DUF167 domain-containing protein [Candidatus Saccharibacteria bacterium]
MKIHIHIKPNSKKGPKIEEKADELVVHVREVAMGGQANEALVKLLSNYYDVPKSKIKIIRGHTSRHKIVEIENGKI